MVDAPNPYSGDLKHELSERMTRNRQPAKALRKDIGVPDMVSDFFLLAAPCAVRLGGALPGGNHATHI